MEGGNFNKNGDGSIFVSADYVNGEFDVTGSGFWRPDQNEIDYSGFLGQIGMIFRF
jgi:hypothetical protein